MQNILKWKLQMLARWYLKRYKPTIIAVTGNAGKTSTKEAIGAVVGSQKRVRISEGNLNNELGVPLTILGDWGNEYYEKGPSRGFWLKVLFTAWRRFVFAQTYPEVLLLEYGADHPGDIQRLARRYRPDIGVVTTVGDVPVHIEFFKDAEAVAAEKSELIKALAATGAAILNHDDDRVLDMKQASIAPVTTYGFNPEASVRISDFEYRNSEDGVPLGVTFKLHVGGSFAPIHINGSLGRSQGYAAAAAAAVGLKFGLNLVQISQALTHYVGPKGRLKILPGLRQSAIIDDTYNASPASMRLALETLRDLPGIRKVAVLGDMLELGDHTIQAHRAIGILAAEFIDLLVCVGSRAAFIAEAARSQMDAAKILIFETSEEAAEKIPALIQQYDVVLVKSSQGIRTEKIVAAILADPAQAKQLLVRQSARWLKK